MDLKQINQIFADTAYVHTGGSEEELKVAKYLQGKCEALGLQAEIEPFEVDMATMQQAELYVDGKKITCKGYLNCGSGEIEAELYYMPNKDKYSLSQCRGKIVMIDGYLGYWTYQDLLENGAVGFITYDGDTHYADRDIDQRELRSYVSKGNKILGVNINVKDALALFALNGKTAKIVIAQDEYKGESRNVVLDMPGEIDEYIVMTAHYDSTWLSNGAYDNMSGSVGLLYAAEQFAKVPHRYGVRIIWCGSEERGLLGSKAYCAAHEDKLSKIAMVINLDMIGCIMGHFLACCTSEEKLVHYIEYFAGEYGFGMDSHADVYSSDSTPFADKGIPAVSFARIAPNNVTTIHNSYDTLAVMSAEQQLIDMEFIYAFTERMANAKCCPVSKEMPEKMKEKLDIYLCRKRKS